jgi:hypothetical protein
MTAVAVPLAAGLNPQGQLLMQAASVAAPIDFENPHLLRYDSKCFTFNNQDTLVVSAAFHYPRCPKALWRDRLQKLKLAGFNTIETYIFWNYHEREESKIDLSEFEAFVKLVHEMGFMMIVRPGPYVCAEWERGGFPSWVAAKRFPLRSNDPQSLATSQHWYSAVLPVIMKNQLMLGGPIIMVQVENEYDFSPPMPDDAKREYIRALAQMVWNAGITVPVFTSWTRQARENGDPDMARIMDTCNFYPRWKIVEKLTPALEKLRREEPNSPPTISELQGGWFSTIGGILGAEQEGTDAREISTLTKTALELGVTSFNYYMGCGGTNFEWAAKKLTTTYDYAAPIREPGGLWDKYYTVRGICQSLRVIGDVLTRATALPGAQSSNASVSVNQRTNGPSSVLFVRENSDAAQHFTMTFTDPHSPSKRIISAPRQGEMELAPREMKMLPVQIKVSGGRLCYSTGELLTHGVNLDRDFMILFDEPGRMLEMGLATEDEPIVEGQTDYRYWDPEYETSVLAVEVGPREKMLLYQNHLQIFVVPRSLAFRTFFWEFPPKIVPGSEETKTVAAPILTDAYSLAASGTYKTRAWVDLEFLPGQHDVSIMLPPLPIKLRVDDVLTDFQYERPWHLAHVHVTTPPAPFQTTNIIEGDVWLEKFDPTVGDWLTTPLHALEDLGSVPYGYVKYRGLLDFHGESRMYISTRADDGKKVFINGKYVAEASNAEKFTDFSLSSYAQPGSNLVEISYEQFGAPSGSENLGELKGLESVGIGADFASARSIESWQIQRWSAIVNGREVDSGAGLPPPEQANHKRAHDDRHPAGPNWEPSSFVGVSEGHALAPTYTWCRANFTLPPIDANWQVAWKLAFDADCDALIYLNGKFVGRFSTLGPQREFYLPEPFVASTGQNVLMFVLAHTNHPRHFRTLQVAPYAEYTVRRTRLEFEW